MPGQTGDSYGVRSSLLGRGSIDRRLLRSPAFVVGLSVYRQETPTEFGSSLLGRGSRQETPTESGSSLLRRGSTDRRLLRSPARHCCVAVLQTGDSYGVFFMPCAKSLVRYPT